MQSKLESAASGAAPVAKAGESFLRLRQVMQRVPVAKTTLYEWVRVGKFPKPIKLAPMTSVWRASEVEAWIAEASAGVQS